MRKKILIIVKTYPTLSEKYNELVCTAGILEDGSWIRIYPLPFRKLDYDQRYKKYQWVEVDIEKNSSDSRPESHKVLNVETIQMLETVDTKGDWKKRKDILFKNTKIHHNLTELITLAHDNSLSLAIFKPEKILDFVVEAADTTSHQKKSDLLKEKAAQLNLFQTEEELRKEFAAVNPLPYKFSYKFQDQNGRKATLMIEDWEIGQLYWSCLKRCNNDKDLAVKKSQRKILG